MVAGLEGSWHAVGASGKPESKVGFGSNRRTARTLGTAPSREFTAAGRKVVGQALWDGRAFSSPVWERVLSSVRTPPCLRAVSKTDTHGWTEPLLANSRFVHAALFTPARLTASERHRQKSGTPDSKRLQAPRPRVRVPLTPTSRTSDAHGGLCVTPGPAAVLVSPSVGRMPGLSAAGRLARGKRGTAHI